MIKNKFKKLIVVSITLITFVYLSTLLYSMSKMTTDEMVMCSAGDGGFYISSNICEIYMKRFKSDSTDIEELSYGGIEVILNLSSDKKYELAEFFISKGLNVNAINQYQSQFGYDLPPVQSAILDNDLKKVNFLILHGANLMARSKSTGDLTSLEFAKSLQEKEKNTDRSLILIALSKHEKHITSH
ncbi:MAG: hypothetical protein ACI88H_003266 [Cocleimonas sp.]|jgi:hypothetical protein